MQGRDSPPVADARRRPATLPEVWTPPADPSWPRRLTAETFGTFALVFVAVGGDAMAVVSGGEVSVAARAVAPGLMVAALIYAIGDASGAHLNPVVSLAFTLKRLFPVAWLAFRTGRASAVGAIAAVLAVRWLFGDAVRAGVTTPHVADGTALVLEAILTMLLVTVILGTADRYRIVGPMRHWRSGRPSRCAGSSRCRSTARR